MDLLTLLLLIVLVVALTGWGYGTYAYTRPAAGTEVVAAPAWVSPLGIVAALAVVAVVLMLLTGWQPLGPVFPR
jgi:hypothetical protein